MEVPISQNFQIFYPSDSESDPNALVLGLVKVGPAVNRRRGEGKARRRNGGATEAQGAVGFWHPRKPVCGLRHQRRNIRIRLRISTLWLFTNPDFNCCRQFACKNGLKTGITFFSTVETKAPEGRPSRHVNFKGRIAMTCGWAEILSIRDVQPTFNP